MSEIEEEVKEAKIQKLNTLESLKNILNDFEFVEILNENKPNKLTIIKAVKKCEEDVHSAENGQENRDAVFIFEKPHFGLEEIKSYLQIVNPVNVQLENNIYTKLSLYPNMPFNSQSHKLQ